MRNAAGTMLDSLLHLKCLFDQWYFNMGMGMDTSILQFRLRKWKKKEYISEWNSTFWGNKFTKIWQLQLRLGQLIQDANPYHVGLNMLFRSIQSDSFKSTVNIPEFWGSSNLITSVPTARSCMRQCNNNLL